MLGGHTLLSLQGVDQYVMPIHNPRVTLRSALGYGLLPLQGVGSNVVLGYPGCLILHIKLDTLTNLLVINKWYGINNCDK